MLPICKKLESDHNAEKLKDAKSVIRDLKKKLKDAESKERETAQLRETNAALVAQLEKNQELAKVEIERQKTLRKEMDAQSKLEMMSERARLGLHSAHVKSEMKASYFSTSSSFLAMSYGTPGRYSPPFSLQLRPVAAAAAARGSMLTIAAPNSSRPPRVKQAVLDRLLSIKLSTVSM